MTTKCSLIIPCYNEQDNLSALADELLLLPEMIDGEVVLVDNGSSDRTGEVIMSLKRDNPAIVHVCVETNEGYGHGILMGLKAATGTIVGWTHADGQSKLGDCVTGFSMMRTKADPDQYFIKGHRKSRSAYARFFENGMSIFASTLFLTPLSDITAQPTILTKRFVDSWNAPPKDFSLDLFAYVTAKKSGMKVFKFDTEYDQRQHGESTWNQGIHSRIKLILRTIGYSFRLRGRV